MVLTSTRGAAHTQRRSAGPFESARAHAFALLLHCALCVCASLTSVLAAVEADVQQRLLRGDHERRQQRGQSHQSRAHGGEEGTREEAGRGHAHKRDERRPESSPRRLPQGERSRGEQWSGRSSERRAEEGGETTQHEWTGEGKTGHTSSVARRDRRCALPRRIAARSAEQHIHQRDVNEIALVTSRISA